MDFTKFISLLSTEKLFFGRSDLFEDTLEGSMPNGNLIVRPYLYKDVDETKRANLINSLENARKGIRQWTYINCWHANDHESAAMWKLYAKTDEAIAIESSYEALVASVSSDCYAGLVKYIDFERDVIPEGSSWFPFIHKRASFSHENEVRLLIQDFETPSKGREKEINFGTFNINSGISKSVNLKNLVKKVHVSPRCADWFVALTKDVISQYSFSTPVVQSDLYRDPLF